MAITEWILEINGKGVVVTSDSPTVLIKNTKSFVSSFSGVNDETKVEMRSNWSYFDVAEHFYNVFLAEGKEYETVVKKIIKIFE